MVIDNVLEMREQEELPRIRENRRINEWVAIAQCDFVVKAV